MRIGVVVTDEAYVGHVMGLVQAARSRGWEAECFLTETGVMLLTYQGFISEARRVQNSVSVCEHSIDHYAKGRIDVEAIRDVVVIGGQYQDAEMVKRCDKVLVF